MPDLVSIEAKKTAWCVAMDVSSVFIWRPWNFACPVRKCRLIARSLSDAAVWERIEALQADKTKGNGVAGYRKMWHLLKREVSSRPAARWPG